MPLQHIVSINVSTSKAPMHEGNDSSVSLALPATIVAVLVVSLIVVTFCCWWKRHSMENCLAGGTNRKNNDDFSPSVLYNIPVRKFLTNPQYVSADLFEPILVISRDSVELIQDLGGGCFGKVFKGKLQDTDDVGTQMVAVKALMKYGKKKSEENFMREVEIMSSVKHNNIIWLIGIVPKDNDGGMPLMVLEFMPRGDLLNVLRTNSKRLWMPQPGLRPLTKTCLLRMAAEIARGMKYLAERRIAHNELACRNCLVGEGLNIKIADFGLSRDFSNCDHYRIENWKLMPIRWMSPESIKYHCFTLESDIWSFGVVLWEIYSFGKLPYHGYRNSEVMKIIQRQENLQPPTDCPPTICALMRACWEIDPKTRIKFPEISAQLDEMCEAAQSSGYGGGSLPRPPRPSQMQATPSNQYSIGGYYLPPNVIEMAHYQGLLPDEIRVTE